MSGQHCENFAVKRETFRCCPRNYQSGEQQQKVSTAFARDQRWPDVVAGISALFLKFTLFCFAK